MSQYAKQHPTYPMWMGMRQRCGHIGGANPYTLSIYRDRGIRVCDEWVNNFRAFEEWAMIREWAKGKCLCRIDPCGNYSPSNCVITNHLVLTNSRRMTRKVEFRGRMIPLRYVYGLLRCKLRYGVFLRRIQEGWSPEDAAFTPIDQMRSTGMQINLDPASRPIYNRLMMQHYHSIHKPTKLKE